MKKYCYIEPGKNDELVEIVISEQEILDFYWEYWSSGMEKLGKNHLITKENCIEDFCIVHYSSEINEN